MLELKIGRGRMQGFIGNGRKGKPYAGIKIGRVGLQRFDRNGRKGKMVCWN